MNVPERDRRWKLAQDLLTPEMLVELSRDAQKYVESFERLRTQAKDLMDDFFRDVQGYMPVYKDRRPEVAKLREHFMEAATEVEEAWMGADNACMELQDVLEAAQKLTGVRTARSFSLPREFHVPKEVRDQPPMVPEGTDLAIWTYDYDSPRGHVFGGIVFAGKSNKPLWHYTYRNEAERQRKIDKTIEDRKSLMDMKKKRQEDRKNFKHDFKVGDILVASWGYDQTNIDYYEVTELRGAMIILREIALKVVGGGRGYDEVTPEPGHYVGPALKRRPTGTYVKVDGSRHASKWDGKPDHQTASGWGH